MPIRDIIVTVVVLVLLPFCLRRPWVGVLVWSWLGYMNPHRLTWGFAYTMPFASMVAICTLVGLLFAKDRRFIPRTIEVWLLVLFWGLMVLSTFGAMFPDDAWEQLDKVSKIFLMVFVTMVLFQDQKRIRALLWVIGLSIGFFGLKGGIWALMTGGGNMVLGPPSSFISGNTEIGLALNMILPFLVFLRADAPNWWVKQLMSAMVVFTVVATLFTYSRGAVLGLGVVLAMLLFKSRAKVPMVFLLIIGYFAAPAVLPEKWFSRMDTIQTYEKDSSAQGRLTAWSVATKIANDHPFFGAGFRPFRPVIYQMYTDGKEVVSRDAHSIFFQVLAEHGYTGLILYASLILATIVGLRQVRWRAAREPSKEWLGRCAHMLETSVIGYVAAGAFLSLSYFDLFYHIVALTACLKVLVRQPVPAAVGVAPAPAPVPVATGALARLNMARLARQTGGR